MNQKYSNVVMVLLVLVGAYSACQEFIKPKSKQKSVSEQQSIELDGDLVVCGTQLSGLLIDFSKSIFLVTQGAVSRVNDYACGEKSCLVKSERTALYAKKKKIKEKIESCNEQIARMLQSIDELAASLNE